MKTVITEKEIETFKLTEADVKTMTHLLNNGLSKAEALVKMGKATMKVIDCNKEKATKKATTTPREKKIDPDKNWLLNFLAIPMGGSDKITNLVNDGSKSIDFEMNGESYTLTLTKHKKKA